MWLDWANLGIGASIPVMACQLTGTMTSGGVPMRYPSVIPVRSLLFQAWVHPVCSVFDNQTAIVTCLDSCNALPADGDHEKWGGLYEVPCLALHKSLHLHLFVDQDKSNLWTIQTHHKKRVWSQE